jgi:cytochrome c
MPTSRALFLAAAALAALAAAPAYATGDAAAGEKTFRKCETCHTVAAGKTKPTGPNLLGVVGRKAGATDFRYSDAMKRAADKGLIWDEKNLNTYLENPHKFLDDYVGDPKAMNKMMFSLKNPKEREDVIAYLKSLK